MQIDLEQAILGCVLKSKEAATYALTNLEPTDFEKHEPLFETMKQMHQKKMPIDMTSLVAQLGKNITKVGGALYIAQIADQGLPSNIITYCNQLKDSSKRRDLRKLLLTTLEQIKDGEETESLYTQVQKGLNKTISMDRPYKTLDKAMFDYMETLDERQQRGAGISWGFTDIDKALGPLLPKRLYYVGARPGMGKTAFALSIILKVIDEGHGVYFNSMEMDQSQIIDRMVSMISGISGQVLQVGDLTDLQYKWLTKATSALYQKDYFGIDDVRQTTGQLKLKATHFANQLAKQGKELGLIVVDYFQLFKNPLSGMKIDEWTQQVSADLVELSKELNCTVLCLSQLNRENEKTGNKKPQISHLRGGGAQEQDAWGVMLLHREDYYDHDKQNPLTEVIIAKNRSGPVGTVYMEFLKEETKFRGTPRRPT